MTRTALQVLELIPQLFFRFMSRKLFFSLVSSGFIFLILREISRLENSGSILLYSVPVSIVCLTIICVTYVTGQAKIDVAANIQGGIK